MKRLDFRLLAAGLLILGCNGVPRRPSQVPPPKILAPSPQETVHATIIEERGTNICIDDPNLAPTVAPKIAEYKDLEREKKELLAVSDQDPRAAARIAEIRGVLRELLAQINAAINQEYEVKAIDFIELNNTALSTESEARLKLIRPKLDALCKSKRPVIVYGYGCFIGTEEDTKIISKRRADAIKEWIRKNTNCSIKLLLTRGVGIAISRDDIERSDVTETEKAQLLALSRHAEIFIHK